MSNRQQVGGIVGAVVGAVIAAYTGNYQAVYYGYVIGAGIGSLATTTQVEGPRVDQTPIPGAKEGDPIPFVIGIGRVAGVVAWASPKRNIPTTTSEGKGGGVETTTYTGEVDVLLILAANRCDGVRRIWRYGELVYTAATDATTGSLEASATSDKWRRLQFYNGAPDQLPDPVYEAALGVGNAPAHRNCSSVFIEGLQLGPGGQLPVLNFELVEDGTLSSPVDVYILRMDDIFWNEVGGREVTPVGSAYDLGEVPGRFLNAGRFGSLNYGSIDTPAIASGTAVTMECWWRMEEDTTDGGGGMLIDLGNTTPFSYAQLGPKFGSGPSTRQFYFRVRGTEIVSPVETPGIDWDPLPWRHLCGTYDGTTSRLFINGVLVASGSPTAGTGVGGLLIGSGVLQNVDDRAWLDDVRVTVGLCRYTASFAAPEAPHPYDAQQTIAPNTRTLASIITGLTERTGILSADDIDVSALTAIQVRGLVVDRPTSIRAVQESLLSAFFVDPYEGDVIGYTPRGGAPVLTIPYEDLGASEGEPVAEPFPINRRNDIEVPARVYGRFPNAFDDYQVGLTPVGDRLTTDSLEDRIIEIPVVLTPSEAARIVDVAVNDLERMRMQLGPIAVTQKYAALDASKVVLVTDREGSTYRARITRITDAGPVRQLELASDDATVLSSAAAANDADLSSTIVTNIAPTEIEAMDTPILRDADDSAGHYERFSAVGPWNGARFQRSLDSTSWEDVVDVTDRATYGLATGALADWTGGNRIDHGSRLTVDVAHGEFSSITFAAMLASRSANLIAVGAHGRWELLQYQTATLLDADTVVLSNLLRGRFGTEDLTGDHEVGDRVVLMRPAGIRRVAGQTSDLGVERFYRAISFGKLPGSAVAEAFTNMGRGLRPYSPTNPMVARDSSGNATISWYRRTRLATRFGGPLGSAVPLGEAVEAWSIDVFDDDTYTTVVRTLTSADSEVAYSAADQTTDFGSPQAELFLRVHQLSAAVGRGVPLEIAA